MYICVSKLFLLNSVYVTFGLKGLEVQCKSINRHAEVPGGHNKVNKQYLYVGEESLY